MGKDIKLEIDIDLDEDENEETVEETKELKNQLKNFFLMKKMSTKQRLKIYTFKPSLEV